MLSVDVARAGDVVATRVAGEGAVTGEKAARLLGVIMRTTLPSMG